MTDPIRLSKRVIELTGCSRREAELYIGGGWVTVDGEVIDEPQFKVADQRVELLPGASPQPLEPVTLLLNQPAGALSGDEALRQLLRAETHWALDPLEQRVLKGHFVRLSGSVPLVAGASGLAVFTQDWRTQRKLTSDIGKLEQEYIVEVKGEISPTGFDRLKRGQTYKGVALPPCKASWQNESHLRIVIKNPGPDLIQTLCASVGLHVAGLKRIRVGGVSMGKLPLGEWRYVAPAERF
ncbi:rRNA pseudouridine synthase [Stutzerimonas urumqiensis]|uniref:rRNA pseudouridine synthase n=1 Tax=Stutzerimonas urumqiensis TaxID=638269 RepID=UPI000EB41F55|nr:rRNA pseudouridine synthase [Stutzerimonas urumqiensis]